MNAQITSLIAKEVHQMGNCMAGEKRINVVRIMMDSGRIIEIKGPLQVRALINDFPGYAIFHRGSATSPLMDHEQLERGRLYYLLPMAREQSEFPNSDAIEEFATKMTPLRLSTEASSELVMNTTMGSSLEVLPSPGNGVWRVKLVISSDQLAEVLSEQVNTQALIERMRAAASMNKATLNQAKGTWGGNWRPAIHSICNTPP